MSARTERLTLEVIAYPYGFPGEVRHTEAERAGGYEGGDRL